MNNDLVSDAQTWIIRQLQITEVLDGATFDQRITNDPNYPSVVKQMNERILVIRDFRELENRDVADLVVFVKNGLASIEQNNLGPPGQTYKVKNLHWGQLIYAS